jgi:hypothetical protein
MLATDPHDATRILDCGAQGVMATGAAPIGRTPPSPSRRGRAECSHKADQVGFPHHGVIMGEMPMRLVAVWDQHVAAFMNHLHRALDHLGRVGDVLNRVDQQYLGLDVGKIAGRFGVFAS